MPTIDVHTHWFPESWPDLDKRFGGRDWPRIKHVGKGKAEIYLGKKFFRSITAACWDADERRRDMERAGVDVQVISPTPVMFAYERPAKQAAEAAKLFNDALLEFCARDKKRFRPLCQVPLQNVDAACKELSRCMKAGHLGVEIGNHVGLKNLDDPGIVEFLQECARVGAAVFVHPWDMMACDRMPEFMMPWTVGMPAETQLAIVALIESGAFDRLPKNLRLCFAHGGGSFAFLLGRLENAWHHHPVARGKSEKPPHAYVERFFVDSAVFEEKTLRFLIETMGAERVLLGSDYPYPLGEERAGQLVRASRLAPEVKSGILGDNAQRWLGMKAAPAAPTKKETAVAATSGGCPVAHTDGDGDGRLTYGSYLQLPGLLHLQTPQSEPPHHDEMMFIIIHQTYELWFKELLHDLDAVAAAFREVSRDKKRRDEIYEAARLLRRCTEIMRIAIAQFTILETMLPTHFLAFREKLEPASGFQSEQFREIEFLCGLKDEKLLKHHDPSPEAQAALERRLREPSLHDLFFAALHAIGKLPVAPAKATEEQRARAVRDLYVNEKQHRDWLDVCERLVEFDELVMSWRLRHIQLVERTIGMKSGTGGSAGSSYLRTTLDKKFFPELWEARTMLELPGAKK